MQHLHQHLMAPLDNGEQQPQPQPQPLQPQPLQLQPQPHDDNAGSVELTVRGMLCMENCGRGVERALAACPLPAPYAVAAARVDFPAQTAHVAVVRRAATTTTTAAGAGRGAEPRDESPPSEVVGALCSAVEAAGYEVESASSHTAGGRWEPVYLPLSSARRRRARRQRSASGDGAAAAAAAAVGVEISIGGMTWYVRLWGSLIESSYVWIDPHASSHSIPYTLPSLLPLNHPPANPASARRRARWRPCRG